MSTDRITRVNELLRREIGAVVLQVLSREPGLNAGAVTVTRVETSRNLRHAEVWVSVLGEAEGQRALLAAVRRHRPEIQERVSDAVVLKYTPRLTFTLDHSVEQGDRVLGLLAELEQETPEAPDGEEGS